MSEFWQSVFTVLVSVLIAATFAYGHPGGLDNDDCHVVQQDWKYKSGKVLKQGTRHCHSPLNAMALDGRQLLEDPEDKGKSVKEKNSKGKQ
jgi:hypothetical protein